LTAGDPLFEQVGVSAAQLGELLELLSGTDVTELDVTLSGARLTLRRKPTPRLPISDGTQSTQPQTEGESPTLAIASPLVGIFRPTVSVGESLSPGQSIGAIEALGMPTTVDAPQGGTVEDVLVAAGSPVEYGQPLLVLRRAPHEA
jgi:biotin carboxyl carrier protein